MAIERLQVILEMVTGNYQREAKQAADSTGKISTAASGVSSAVKSMIGPAAIGGAVLGLGKMALAAGENADRLFDLAAQTGLSTDALQEWEFVAASAGAKQEFFADAVKQVIKNMDQAKVATSTVAEAYAQLGVSVTDSSGSIRDAGDITGEVIERLAGMTNITERNALAQDLFGKKWEETISVLDMGSEAIANLREEGKEAIVSQQSLQNADKFRETWAKFQAQIGPKLNEILGKIAPALTEVADTASEALDAMEPLIDALGFIAEKFDEANVAIEQGRDSPSVWAQSLAAAADIGKGAIFGVVGALGALFDEENRITGPTEGIAKAIDNGAKAAQFMADATKDDLIPALGEVDGAASRVDRSFIDAKLAAQAAGKAFRDDLAADYRQAAISIDKTSDAMAVSLDEIEKRLLKNIEDQAAFYSNLLILAEAGMDDLANFLRGQGAAVAGGAAADLVNDLGRALSLETTIEQAERDAAAVTDALADALDSSKTRLLEVASSLGIDIAAMIRAGLLGNVFTTKDIIDTLGAGLGAPGPIVNAPTSSGTTSGGSTTVNVPRFQHGGIVPGVRGSEQLILAHAGETVLPTHRPGPIQHITRHGPTITLQGTGYTQTDIQYATIAGSVLTIVEGLP